MTNLEALREALAIGIEAHAKECHKCGGSGMLTNTGPDPLHDPCPTCEPYYWLASEARALDLTPFQSEGWISVADRLPEDRQTVLVQNGIAYWRNPCPEWPEGAWFSITGLDWPGRQIMWNVTHWMPLLAPSVSDDSAGTSIAVSLAPAQPADSQREETIDRDRERRSRDDSVICPGCSHEFVAVSVDSQRRLQEAQRENLKHRRDLEWTHQIAIKKDSDIYALTKERDAALREAESLRTDAGRYRHLRMQSSPFLVLQPRTTGHIGYYGDELDRRIDAAKSAGGAHE